MLLVCFNGGLLVVWLSGSLATPCGKHVRSKSVLNKQRIKPGLPASTRPRLFSRSVCVAAGECLSELAQSSTEQTSKQSTQEKEERETEKKQKKEETKHVAVLRDFNHVLSSTADLDTYLQRMRKMSEQQREYITQVAMHLQDAQRIENEV